MLNRADARMPIFPQDEDFITFETVLEEAVARTGTRLLSYCRSGNHWHLVVWPEEWDSGSAAEKELLSGWPLRRSSDWREHGNSPQTDADVAAIRRTVNRGSPSGDETWATTATPALTSPPAHKEDQNSTETVPDTFVLTIGFD